VNLLEPYVTDRMRQAVADTLSTRWIGQGPQVDEFERRFAALYPERAAVATGAGTDALHLAYQLAGIGPGSKVVAPLFTCTATNIPLLWLGADLVFADVAPGSLNVGQEQIDAILERQHIDAVVVVHYGGAVAPVDLDGLPYPVVEDCAQALGADVGHADFSCFSFQAVKHVTTGDGGMLLLSGWDEELVQAARRLRWFGIDRAAKQAGLWENDIREAGFKYQMTDIAASMGIAGLDDLADQLEARHGLMAAYADGLEGIDGIRLVDDQPYGAAWLCTIAADRRDDLKRMLADRGIESDQLHSRNDRYTIFERFRGRFPNMDEMDGQYLCLPFHMGLGAADVEEVCDAIRSGW
jgi:perosamine synthetase